MTAKNRFSRPVAFNRKNSADQKRLEHIGERAFSTYVKDLIDEDILRAERIKRQNEANRGVKSDTPKIIRKEGNGIKIVIG